MARKRILPTLIIITAVTLLFVLISPSNSEARINQTATSSDRIVQRIPSPYKTPSMSFDKVNLLSRAATVNIFCTTSTNSLDPISASGVIIDSRGIILTNAHVGQYLLLKHHPRTSGAVNCVARTDSPARERYKVEVMYMPRLWIQAHALELTKDRPSGTGEHDWALLKIVGMVDGAPLPKAFPSLLPDPRELVVFPEDSVLLAAYPAGFLKSSIVSHDLYAVSTVVTTGQLYTFKNGTVDAFSLGGNIIAQAGSSGGPVVNSWGRVVGIITTSSEALSTDARELRAITFFHIDKSIKEHTNMSLFGLLSKNPDSITEEFLNFEAANLAQYLYDALIRSN